MAKQIDVSSLGAAELKKLAKEHGVAWGLPAVVKKKLAAVLAKKGGKSKATEDDDEDAPKKKSKAKPEKSSKKKKAKADEEDEPEEDESGSDDEEEEEEEKPAKSKKAAAKKGKSTDEKIIDVQPLAMNIWLQAVWRLLVLIAVACGVENAAAMTMPGSKAPKSKKDADAEEDADDDAELEEETAPKVTDVPNSIKKFIKQTKDGGHELVLEPGDIEDMGEKDCRKLLTVLGEKTDDVKEGAVRTLRARLLAKLESFSKPKKAQKAKQSFAGFEEGAECTWTDEEGNDHLAIVSDPKEYLDAKELKALGPKDVVVAFPNDEEDGSFSVVKAKSLTAGYAESDEDSDDEDEDEE